MPRDIHFSRATVLAAAQILKSLGHSGIDSIALEWDIQWRDPSRTHGLLGRVTALAGYALENPEQKTSEGQRLQDAIVWSAIQQCQQFPFGLSNVSAEEREKFANCARKDGYILPSTVPDTKIIGEKSDASEAKFDTEAELAVTDALITLISTGKRAYSFSVPLAAEKLLLQKSEGELSRSAANQRVQNAIVSLVERGVLVAPAEGYKDWILTKQKREQKNVDRSGKVFIGHGHSHLWRELKDFISDRLKLAYDEFNHEPTAGKTHVSRISEMLDDAAFAFLIFTAEDERSDGGKQARMNVIHEAGLFQGRLGFEKAIILLEEGCGEFSNIHGLGQIRFPHGNIGAVFEEIRRVLEREGIILT